MNTGRRVGAVDALWILARLATRRFHNLFLSLVRVRKSADGLRRGSSPRSRARILFAALIIVLIPLQGMLVDSRVLVELSSASRHLAEQTDKIVLSPFAIGRLDELAKAIHEAEGIRNPVERQKFTGMFDRQLDQVFMLEIRRGTFTEEEEPEQLRVMRAQFAKKGVAGFTHGGREMFVSGATWPRSDEAASVFSRMLALMLLAWSVLIVLVSLATNQRDLGLVEWSLEWLYSFPVSARVLFSSRLFSYSFLNPLMWGFLLPFLSLIYYAAGWGHASFILGLAATVSLAIITGSLTMVLEIALRTHLSPRQLKNVQAGIGMLGTAAFMLFAALAISKPADRVLVRVATALSPAILWNPFSVPLIIGLPHAPLAEKAYASIAMIAAPAAIGILALLAGEWITRDGLVRSGSSYQGASRGERFGSRYDWLTGVVASEALLLIRDRYLFVQTLFIPFLGAAFYVFVIPGMANAVRGNFHHAATLAYFIAALYTYPGSAMLVLNREQKTLWYLLSMPQTLASILLKKAATWGALGLVNAGTVMLLIAVFSRHLHLTAIGDAALALFGTGIYAFIACAIGILGTDASDASRRARPSVAPMYLFIALALMYANVFYTTSMWNRFAQLTLSTLLALALWQKVDDASPYLLDPFAQPARSISIADGMIAALAFFVVQGLVATLIGWMPTSVSMATQMAISYFVAGVIVATGVLFIYWWQGVPAFLEKTGIAPLARKGAGSIGRSVVQGAMWGAAAALAGIVYLCVLDQFPQFEVWKQDAEATSFFLQAKQPIVLSVLVIAGAPLFEEFLFRGLVFQGLRRATKPILAVLGSAALFALVHPPISVIPVFGLGVAAAMSFNNSKVLVAPIATHAVYNACMLLLGRL